MRREYANVLGFFYGTPWAILPAKLAEIQAVLTRRLDDGPRAFDRFDDSYEGPPPPHQDTPGYKLVGSAAVVPITGTITPRPSLFAEYSGGTSAEQIGRAVEGAAADGKVEHIIIDVDSPGGSIAGAPENMAKILAARKVKPVTAVANHEAASLAYFFASQATTVAVSPGGWVGSVGVIWPRTEAVKAEELIGVKTHLTVAAGSPFKAEGYPVSPMTEEEQADRQRTVDGFFAQFIAATAKGRGIKAAVIERDFGGGRMLRADDALAARMVDRIATLDEVVGEANKVRSGRMKRQVAADLARAGLPTA